MKNPTILVWISLVAWALLLGAAMGINRVRPHAGSAESPAKAEHAGTSAPKKLAGTHPGKELAEPSAPEELTELEENALMRLDALRESEEAAPYLEDLGKAPSLRRYLDGKANAGRIAAFRAWVGRHGKDPGFRKALEAAAEPAPCGPGASHGPAEKTSGPLGLPVDESCSPDSSPSPLF